MTEENNSIKFSSVFEAIQNQPDAENGLVMMAVQLLREDLARLEQGFKNRPEYASLLERMKGNLNAIQWFVEGVQDAHELAMVKPGTQE